MIYKSGHPHLRRQRLTGLAKDPEIVVFNTVYGHFGQPPNCIVAYLHIARRRGGIPDQFNKIPAGILCIDKNINITPLFHEAVAGCCYNTKYNNE